MNGQTWLTVGQLSEQAGVSIRTLHYYEEQGLLSPDRQGTGEHRVYGLEQMERLQQITALKFLGFPLKQIRDILESDTAAEEWDGMLSQLEIGMRIKKEELERALAALARIRALSELNGHEQMSTLMAIIRGIQTEPEQQEWLEQARGNQAAAAIFGHMGQVQQDMDRLYLEFVREVKQRSGGPVHTPEVQRLIEQYMEAQMALVGEEAIAMIGNPEEFDIAGLELLTAGSSPFTPEEEQWLNQAMEEAVRRRMTQAEEDTLET